MTWESPSERKPVRATYRGRPKIEGEANKSLWRRFLELLPAWAKSDLISLKDAQIQKELGEGNQRQAHAERTAAEAAQIASDTKQSDVKFVNEQLESILSDANTTPTMKLLKLETLADAYPNIRKRLQRIIDMHEELQIQHGSQIIDICISRLDLIESTDRSENREDYGEDPA